MPKPTLDFETYSESGHVWNPPGTNPKKPLGYWSALPNASQGKKGLQIVGASVYTEHETAEVLSAHYDLCDGRGVRCWRPGDPLPFDLFAHIAAGGTLDCHNVLFETLVWSNVCVVKYAWPPLDFARFPFRCTMATARVNNLPGALGNLGSVLAVDVQKDKEGKRLLDKFSKPRNPTKTDPRTRIRPTEDPEGPLLYGYGDRDVIAEQHVGDAMEPMTPAELEFWLVDQEIARRGLGVDRAGVRDCIAVLQQAQVVYGAEHVEITGGLEPGQLAEIRGWLAGRGVRLPDMQAETIDDALAGDKIADPPARRVLEIRTLLGSASVKKLFAMEYQANRDNRLQGLIVHHGARTGRPTGEGPQPLNLPKAGPKLVVCGACDKPHKQAVDACPWCGVPCPPIDRKGKWRPEFVEHVLSIMASRSLHLVEWFFGDALLAIQGCVRGLFEAAEGHDLLASDYSAIEAVVAAMISGEQWRIDTFRARKDIYLQSASQITGMPYEQYLTYAEQHGENHSDRQTIGKVAELACLGPNTYVWTTDDPKAPRKARWRKIKNVRTAHFVHDGVRWVTHGGLVCRGVKPVSLRRGILATDDHLFLRGRKWVRFDAFPFDLKCLPIAALFIPLPPRLDAEPVSESETYDLADAGPRSRFIVASDCGPVVAHNCGYGGWEGAWRAFDPAEADKSSDEIASIIRAWRNASPQIVAHWGGQRRLIPGVGWRDELFGIEGAVIAAIQNPGQEYVPQVPSSGEITPWPIDLRFIVRPFAGGPRSVLVMILPSGREIKYHDPLVAPSSRRPGSLEISYMTWNTNPKYGPLGWVRMATWGSRIYENADQAIAHDILRGAILRLRAAGYQTVLHVYDEIVAEVPKGFGSIEEFERLMLPVESYCRDWPIRAAGGWRGKRYRKG